ncbi:hypothetical protein J7E63_22100 [Bacillus sp. ISL-75]|uniref:hypothetical protein n=1 Tax=Bacillus sp. ISL-75 TaxID=2819137 RepID=UPI001BE64E48|nr:hypothetical protein [Bacillus sp. ISL-75]MBT2729584.1 hypothetical protein [Bacillus sp. ISL-75]
MNCYGFRGCKLENSFDSSFSCRTIIYDSYGFGTEDEKTYDEDVNLKAPRLSYELLSQLRGML